MFDRVQSLYQDYVDKPSVQKFTVGIDIRDQRLPFMFEIIDPVSGVPEASYILPFNPEGYNFDPVFRSSVTMTQGGGFEDKIGLGFPRISLAGTFGYLGTLPAGSNGRHIDGDKKDGWDLYKEVEDMLLDFHARFGTSEDTTNPVDSSNIPELRFYNYCDKHFYVIQLQKFRISRSIARRHLYQYDIQMTGIKKLNDPTGWSLDENHVDMLLSKPQIPAPMGPWDQILAGYSTVMTGMDKIVSAVQGIQADLAEVRTSVIAFRNGVSAVIAAPFALVRSAIDTIDTVLSTVFSLTDIPQEFTTQMRETKRELLQLTFHKDKFVVPLTTISPARSTQVEISTVPIASNQSLSIEMDTPETTLFAPGQESVQSVAVSEEPILENDTIESVAFRTLGDASQWRRLADMNGLEYPFIAKGMAAYSPVLETGRLGSQDGVVLTVLDITPIVGEIVVLGDEYGIVNRYEAGIVILGSPLVGSYPPGTTITRHERALAVFKPGDKAAIPGSPQTPLSILANTGDAFAARIYGTDETIDNAGAQIGAAGNVDTTAGLENLVMQLQHRLNTVQGELFSHPRYGSYLPKIIGKIAIDLWLERALLEAEITVLADPRVKEVKKIRFQVVNTAIYIDVSLVPVGKVKAQSISILVG